MRAGGTRDLTGRTLTGRPPASLPRVGVPPGLHPSAGCRAGAGTGSPGRGLVVAQLCPPHIAPFVKAESQRPAEEEEEEQQEQEQREIPGDLDQEEPSLLYADLDYTALWGPRRLSSVAPTDASTVYAVVV
ncbi:megakaryocyte and platelet inhibitory receptor G6b [Fukomys damarensis]|uniref:megakaryocyte and platelet inhibitory receptor G6b n=1 Tax=Fukomys damarensis TaxID=885580 RepID=UPI00053FBCF6|nr:megakaryocyte and platelet inhibitory receptor G6b [Fukomys damarensis]